MKSALSKVALLVGLSVVLMGNTGEATPNTTETEDEWFMACTLDELDDTIGEGEELIGISDELSVTLHTDTIKVIDRKKKLVSAWVTYYVTLEGQQSNINEYGVNYGEVGYMRQFKVFNLKNKSVSLNQSASYSCGGNNLSSNSYKTEYDHIVPGSLDESVLIELKAKTKL